MNYEIIVVGSFEVNCVVLWNNCDQAWVVDPGADAPVIGEFLEKNGLKVGLYFLTHGHIDHISALDTMLTDHPAPVYMQGGDVAWAFSAINRFPPYLRVPTQPTSLVANMADIKTIALGGIEAEIITTPGHSPGGQCLWFAKEELLLSGDTLFACSVGRTDLPGGDGKKLQKSLQRLMKLPESTIVIPGHGPTTTVATERRDNPYIN